MPTLSLLLALVSPAHAQQVIQIPLCGGTLPTSINPSAPTIAVNPSGQVCIAGNFSASVPTPTIVFPQPDSVVVTTVAGVISGAYANGAIVAEGSTSDGAATATFTSGSIITWLRGIFENTITPISVSGSFTANQTGNNIALVASQQIASPSTYGVAPVGSVLGVNSFVTNQPTVVLSGSPVSVGIAAGSSPINVTGNFTSTQTGNNIVQLSGQQLASPSTYGVAPVGSVQGTNAFVTNNVNVTPPTPLQVTLPASPVSVGVANANINVTTTPGVSPQNVTVSTSPVAVTIASSPINVTGNFATTTSPQSVNLDQINGQLIASPSTYGLAPVGSVQGVNSFVTNNVNVTPPTPLQVTLPASPVSVGLAGPTPLSVVVSNSPTVVPTGTLAVNVVQATGQNIDQISGQIIASPSTYGVAPVGSVQGVNSFITNNVNVTPPTPLQVTLPASPVSVGIAGPTPLNVTIATSPVAVSGSFTATQTGNNIVQWGGQLIASASTYGVAPVGSVGAVNAFVTNGNPNGQATMANSSPVVIASDQTPLNVQLATVSSNASPLNVTTPSPEKINIVQWQGTAVASPSTYGVAPVGSVGAVNAFVTNNVNVTPPTPLQVTLPASPISVGIANASLAVSNTPVGSPQNVTVATSPINTNIVQWQGTNIASPSTYGVAPVGSVGAVNAFVTNNVNVTPPTPLNVTLVAIPGSPQNMTLTGSPVSVGLATGMNLVQWQGITIASPSTYGTAPVGSVGAVNAFMTNANPNGSNTSANSQPVVIANDQTAVTVNTLAGSTTNSNIIAWTVTSAYNVTNAVLALGATPGIVGVHQLGTVNCAAATPVATPPTAWLQIFDTTPHATGSDITLGATVNAKVIMAVAGSPVTAALAPESSPGMQFSKGITIAFTQGAFKSATAVGVNLHCTIQYN